MAATAVVDPDRLAHSLHAYFLRRGSEVSDIAYRVERDFDGGSFSARRVIAEQDGRPILSLAASFHKREAGVSHQDAMPEVPPPEDMPSEAELRRAVIDKIPEQMQRPMTRPRPIEFRPSRRAIG
jgi:acyl-CoA thioesterase-2